MTAPFTKVAILFTGTALLLTSLRDTHKIAYSVHRDSAFVYNAHKHCRLCAQGRFFRLLFCTTHNIAVSVHRDSVFCPLVRVTVYIANEPVQCFSFQNLCDAQKGADYVHKDSVCVH